mgnify:CR=1 FL=1
MELAVLNTEGKETGRKVVLADSVFGVEANDHAIYLDVKQYLADQRQGTHKSKQRNEVAGSTRKLKRQKGTGGARCGSIKSPLFPGGGRIFGPVPRDYSFKLNKKLKQLARRSALTYKAQAGAIQILEAVKMEAPKTKQVIALTEALKVADKKVLLVLPETNVNLQLSCRNIPSIKPVLAQNVCTYDLMNASAVVMVEGEKLNRYGFIVDVRANKLQIRNAVEQMYGVVVTDVNTINYMGKLKSRYTKAGLLEGRANNFKKAIVTLKDGDKIDFYSNI